MTGETLYIKAQNGSKGFPPWEKLPAGQKGLWANAVREIQHEKDKLLLHGHQTARAFERTLIAEYIESGDHTYLCDGGLLDDIKARKHCNRPA